MSTVSHDYKSADDYDVNLAQRSQIKSTTQPPATLHPQRAPHIQPGKQQVSRPTRPGTDLSASPDAAADTFASINDVVNETLEDSTGSLFSGRADPVEVWIPNTRWNPVNKKWDKPVTTQYLLNTLYTIHKLIPIHLGVQPTSGLVGEIDFQPHNLTVSESANRFYALDNLDHSIDSTSYTNTLPTANQLNLTRNSGSLPRLTRSNGLFEGAMKVLYTNHPEAIDVNQIDPYRAPFNIESSMLSLSDIDVVPVTVHHNQRTTTTTSTVDPKTNEIKDQRTSVQNEPLPDTVAFARGTSIQRIYDTRNSGMVPELNSVPYQAKNIFGTIPPITNPNQSISPEIIIANPLSHEKITFNPNSAADQLTQAEIDSIGNAICIYRNRNLYRDRPPYQLAQDFIANISNEILEHVRGDLNRQYDAEIKSIRNTTSQQQKALQESLRVKQTEAQQAYKEKQTVLNNAIRDLELQCQEAQKRLTISTRESGKAETDFRSQLSSQIRGLETELGKLRQSAQQWQTQLSNGNDPSRFDSDFDSQSNIILDKYNTTMRNLQAEWDAFQRAYGHDEAGYSARMKDIQLERRNLDDTFAKTKSHLNELSKKTTSLLSDFHNMLKARQALEGEFNSRISEANKRFTSAVDQYENALGTKRHTLINQEKALAGLRDKLAEQRQIMATRVQEARTKLHQIELEGCYEIPGHVEVVEKQVPVQQVHYEQIRVQTPVVKTEYHFEVVTDPNLVSTSTTTTHGNNHHNVEVVNSKHTTTPKDSSQDIKATQSNRWWFGSVVDRARNYFKNNPIPVLVNNIDSDDEHVGYGHYHYRNIGSLIATSSDDEDSFQRFASLTDDDSE
jgi:predicted  nucleic acid-binding Zn-ribbon protein